MAGGEGRQPDLTEKMSQNGVKSLHLLRGSPEFDDFNLFLER